MIICISHMWTWKLIKVKQHVQIQSSQVMTMGDIYWTLRDHTECSELGTFHVCTSAVLALSSAVGATLPLAPHMENIQYIGPRVAQVAKAELLLGSQLQSTKTPSGLDHV